MYMLCETRNTYPTHPGLKNIIRSLEAIVTQYKNYPYGVNTTTEMKNITATCDIMRRVAQSVQRLATGWTVRGSNPGVGEIFRTCPDPPWGPPNLLYNGYRFFPGVKERPGRDADPSLPSSAVIKIG